MTKKAVILLSGGLDSATTLAIAKHSGYECYALSVNYGQRHAAELQAAQAIAHSLQVVKHKVVNINLNDINASALIAGNAQQVPDFSPSTKKASDITEIPTTYVPARNTTFLSLALGYAESIGAFDIFIGACQLDYSGYPDCRGEFIAAFETLANLATKAGVLGEKFTIHAPLLNFTKAETVLQGTKLGLDYSKTISCYRATESGLACGSCDSCHYRKKGFADAGLVDPTRYR
jgi:7-cyano-7-deazaguanine synthase